MINNIYLQSNLLFLALVDLHLSVVKSISAASLSPRSPTRCDKNLAVQPHKMARGLKFWIQEEKGYEEEGLFYLCSKSKSADQLCSAFVFAHMQKAGFRTMQLNC